MLEHPFYSADSDSVCFRVEVDAVWIDASIRKEVLHYRYRPHASGDDPLETYRSHASEINAAVHRRVAAGAWIPVVVKEADLRAVAGA